MSDLAFSHMLNYKFLLVEFLLLEKCPVGIEVCTLLSARLTCYVEHWDSQHIYIYIYK